MNSVSSRISKFKPSKKTILIGASSLLVLAVLIVSLAAYQVDKQHKQKAAEQARADNTALITKLSDQVKTEQASNAQLMADKKAGCDNYKALSTAKATRSLVVIPTAMHCQ